jgi:hypothetical protein
MLGFEIITQFEQGVVYRWGRILPGVREPGLAGPPTAVPGAAGVPALAAPPTAGVLA